MARVSVGATAGIGGPSGAGSTPPLPTSSASGLAYGASVTRAKYIAGGLFVLLVLLHAKGSRS